jgi:ligand-binding sensor domain-containing protein/two-component sensor histidine kinase
MLLQKKYTILFYLLFISFLANSQHTAFKNISIKDGLPQSDVFDAVQDDIGYLWFATQGGGVAKYDGNNFTIYNQNKGLLSNFTNALLLKNDCLIVGTNNGLSILYKEKFTNYKTPKINSIHLLNDEVYLATIEGIYLFKKDFVTPIKINLKIDLSNILNITYTGSYYWIRTETTLWKTKTLKNPTSILKATVKETATFLNAQNQLINTYKSDAFLVNKKIKKVFLDQQKNTWLLTQGNGVYKSIPHNFNHFTAVNNKKIGQITATHTNNNNLWFADRNTIFKNDSLGLQIIDKQDHQFKITTITTDANNNLWIGSENKGIYIFRKQADSLNKQAYNIERLYVQNGFPNNKIKKIHIQNDTVWVVTKNAGIIKLEYDFKKSFVKKIHRFNSTNGIKDHAITTSLLYNNSVWYGTKQGALGYIKNNSVVHFSNVLKQKTTINAITFHKNKIYLGTLGLGIWAANNNQVQQLKLLKTSFLSSLNIYQLVVDVNNNLWVGSEKGLDELEFKNSTIIKTTHYNANDGFTGIETTLNTAAKTANNILWFGTKNGITRYKPTTNNSFQKKPSIHFENIEIAYQPLDHNEHPFKKAVLQLSPTQNHVSFTFKTVDINQPNRIEYQWDLNGEKSTWSPNNTINFANQSAGDYTFTVKSRNAFKIESEPKTFRFFIETPLLKKSWFLWSIGGITLFIFSILITRYIENIKRKNNAEIEKLTLKNHLISLEQKALQLQMNPHFIFNVLNGIKALGNSDNKDELNTTVSQFASLLRAILNNSRAQEISLAQEIDTLKNYLELERKMASSSFEYAISTNTNSIDLEEILIPPMLLQPFVENSIKHGFKGIKITGKIEIDFSIKNDFLYCSVIDNGVGFKHSKLPPETHKSVALKITKERIENLSKYSAFVISEIKEQKQIRGTKIAFKIPLKTDY